MAEDETKEVEDEVVEGEEEEDNVIGGEAEYSPKSDFSKAKLAEEAVRKCFDLRAKEMRSGYYNTKTDKLGNENEEWIGDSRIAFIAGVNGLKCLLAPEIARDATTKKAMENYEGEMGKLFEKWKYEVVKKVINEDKTGWNYKKTDYSFMPEHDAVVNNCKGFWNNHINAYWEGMLVVYDKIFSELNNLCARGNYFKPRTGHE